MIVQAERWYARAHFKLGEAYRKKGLWHKARLEYEISLKLEPDDRQVLVALGETFLAEGKPAEARGVFERAVAIHNNDAAVCLGLGRAYLAEGDSSTAEREFARALSLDPQNPEVHYLMGKLRQERGECREAVGHFEKAASSKHLRLDAQISAGLALAKLGVYDLAAAALKNVLRESPCNVAALLNVAEVYRARGMQYEAIKYFRRMVSLEPDCAETRRSLADLYCERGLTREAIEEYENCLRLCPESDWSGQVEQRMRALAEQGA